MFLCNFKLDNSYFWPYYLIHILFCFICFHFYLTKSHYGKNLNYYKALFNPQVFQFILKPYFFHLKIVSPLTEHVEVKDFNDFRAGFFNDTFQPGIFRFNISVYTYTLNLCLSPGQIVFPKSFIIIVYS